MNKEFERLDEHVFVTKLAGYEHTKYIQKNATHKKNKETDIPMVQGKNIRNGVFVNKYDWYISKEISDMLERSKLKRTCILVPYVGSNLGEVGIFYHDFDCHLASNVAKIEMKDDFFDIEYLKYYLQSNVGQKYLFQAKQGSAQPNITMEAIRNTMVLKKPMDVQKRIASVLRCIDIKIQNNKKVNDELNAMVRTIYNYWFLQFDFPDENGRPYKTSGGKMVWNEELKQEIPEGWEVKRLGKIFDFIKGKIPEELNVVQSTDTLEYLTIDAVNGGDVQYCRRNNMIITSGEVIMVMDGAASSEVYVGNYGVLGSTFCKLVVKNSYLENNFLYVILKEIEGILKKVNTGSTVPHANKKYISDYQICMPSDLGERKQLQKQINNIIDKVIANRKENKELASLRDFLLPLFMSGQVVFGGK